MLSQLTIQNFAVVKNIDVSFKSGLSAITGETGAGKSIGIDALSLCTGARAEANMVRSGANKAEIVAHFDISKLDKVQAWLSEHELDSDGDCFIRRVISAEGRSKAFINGSPVSLQQIKQLGGLLINIHGQNAHQLMLKETMQRDLLDSFAAHSPLLHATQKAHQEYTNTLHRLETLRAESQARRDRRQLLDYQVEELDTFALEESEFAKLEQEFKRYSNSQTLLESAQNSYFLLYDAEELNATMAVQRSIDSLSELTESDPRLAPIVSMLEEANIQIAEASQELRQYCDNLEIDPAELERIQHRFDTANELARKHQVQPAELYQKHQELAQELAELNKADDEFENLETQLADFKTEYYKQAEKLSASRRKAGKLLASKIQSQIQLMNMPHAKMSIEVNTDVDKFTASGYDQIRFTISTNPGQKADILEKVVSGGELARIGLAMHVIASHKDGAPTLIFDEVDTGISGPTASVVGQLLRQMGSKAQVICVTHLPQVAAQAHNQLFVTKQSTTRSTETQILNLTADDRVNELARLLAGDTVTQSALSNARSLLEGVA